MKRLEGRYAVVTGGGSGIGRASAIRLAREGASVLVVGRSLNTEETVDLIRAEGGFALALITDASREENVAEIVARSVTDLGGLDIFFANIGVTGTNTPLLEQTVEEWMEVYRINTVSCFLAIKYAGGHMISQRSGSIIFTSSAASLRANAGAISYSASKAAVNNLAQTAANAFAGTGVRVNAVLPGLVETQLTRKVFEDAYFAQYGVNPSHVPIEVVSWRLTAQGPEDTVEPSGPPAVGEAQPVREKDVPLWPSAGPAKVYARASLGRGQQLAGPALIEERETTIFVLGGWTLSVHADGSLKAKRQCREV